jgi:hypothetical protein
MQGAVDTNASAAQYERLSVEAKVKGLLSPALSSKGGEGDGSADVETQSNSRASAFTSSPSGFEGGRGLSLRAS